jgi:tRNA G18 (ribose-2'-O)-methylase SpoU
MKRIPVVVVLDNVRSAQNIGAFFRTGDAFAIEKICLCGITATPPSRDIHKSALGAELTVEWEYFATTVECVEHLRSQGYHVVAIEQVEGASMLNQMEIDDTKQYALIFGNEVEGVDQAVVDLCDGAIEIPQVGTKHSINVSVAGGVVIWEFYKSLAHTLKKD